MRLWVDSIERTKVTLGYRLIDGVAGFFTVPEDLAHALLQEHQMAGDMLMSGTDEWYWYNFAKELAAQYTWAVVAESNSY